MRKILLIFTMVAFLATAMFAQRTVQGTVTDDSGEPLIGASVVVKGTTMGAVTDIDGKYTLEVPADATDLVVTYTGYGSFEQALGNSNIVNVKMSEGVTLDGLVVTALGIKREKKALGYATQEVASEEVTKAKDANFINSLSGKVAGVNINRSSQLGGSSNVIIRGYKSIQQGNQALFVVDGVPINNDNTNTTDMQTGRGGYDYGNAAMDINPEDIESINVLKGAAASALYGSRASNGVILITTKKGTKRKGVGVTVSTGASFGTFDETTMPRYQNEYGPGYFNAFDYEYDFGLGDGPKVSANAHDDASYGPKFDGSQVLTAASYHRDLDTYGKTQPYSAASTNALDFFETSNTFNTNVAIDGGGENATYRISYTNFNQSGIIPGSKIKKNVVSTAGTYDMTDKLSVSSVVNFVNTKGKGRYGTGYDNRNVNQSFRQWYSTMTDFNDQRDWYESTGKNLSWNPYGALDPDRASAPHYFDNYYFNVAENFQSDERNRIFGNVSTTYKITDWLDFTGRVSTDRFNETQEERIAVGSVDVSSYSLFNKTYYDNNLDLFLTANEYVGSDDKINIQAMLGTNFRRYGLTDMRAETNGGLVISKVYSLSNSVSGIEAPVENAYDQGSAGYFGRLSLGYDQFLYLDLTGRVDQSSTLPVENNTYFYPSASLSLVFSELFNVPTMDFGKLRLNYAMVGKDAPALVTRQTFDQNTPFDGTSLASVDGTRAGPGLNPEFTTNLEAGLDLKFFKNRLGVDFSVYQSVTDDLITAVTTSGATGYNFQYTNAGSIQNQGIEVQLTGTPVQTKDFSWDISINWAKNTNEVLSLFDGQTNLQLTGVQGGVTLNATVGESFGTIWGTNYVYHTDGSPIVYDHPFGGVRHRKTGSPEVIGDINPDWTGGITNTISWKDLSFSFLLDGQKGGDFFSLDTWYGYATGIYDITAGQNKDGVDVRVNPEDGGGIFLDGTVLETGTDADGNPISDGTANTEAFYMDDVYSSLGYVIAPNAYHVYDASFLKLREMSVTYSLPKSMLGNSAFQGIDFSLTGRNLWIIFKNSPYSDPEAGLSAGRFRGNQSGAYPSVREIGINLKATF